MFSFKCCSIVVFLKKTAITVGIALLFLILDITTSRKDVAKIAIINNEKVRALGSNASGTSP